MTCSASVRDLFLVIPLISYHLSAVRYQIKVNNAQRIIYKNNRKSCLLSGSCEDMLAPPSPVYQIKASKYPWAGKNLFCSTDSVACAPPLSSPGDCSWFCSFKTLAQILPRFLSSSLHLLASPSHSLHPSQCSYYLCGRERPSSVTNARRAVIQFDFLLQDLSRKTSGALRSFPPLSHGEGRAEGGGQETGKRAKARGNKNQTREGSWWVSGKESEKKTWIKNGGGCWVEDGNGKGSGREARVRTDEEGTC